MKFTHALQKIGLKEEEAIVYETLISSGQMNILNLSKATGLHRPGLYKILPKLIIKNLVRQIKIGKRIEYIASTPENLEPLLTQSKNILENIVKNLNDEYSKRAITPTVEIKYGEDGLGSIFLDLARTLKKEEVYYRYSVRKDLYKEFRPKEYMDLMESKRIERLVITNDDGKNRKTPLLERSVRILKGDYEIFNITKLIYRDKVAYIDYENTSAFVIQNKRLADMEKQVFINLFKSLPRD